ncbi:MAG: ABC-type tungstate transport system, solute-binding protein [Deltaproteobacteria bacterium]|nr:ABC-type tungstate transport system, solute-binding protein [Deltaproteobacteria bacterium]
MVYCGIFIPIYEGGIVTKTSFKISFFFIIFLVLPVFFCSAADDFVFMASTIGPIDSGIIGTLEDHFEKDTAIRVRHVGAGTGVTLDIAKKGNIDLVLVHARSLEEKFVAEGYGTERIDLMYNDFLIVGPQSDPAGIKGMKNAGEALGKIAEKKAAFLTRGDKSGTHVAELVIWEKAGIKPAGSWYIVYEKGTEGNMPTLREADKRGIYTLMDRATYLSLQKEIKLVVLVEKDEALLNYITLIPVNPKKFPRVNAKATMTYVKWLTDPGKGQLIIRDFGKEKFGSPLFFPNSKEWRARNAVQK